MRKYITSSPPGGRLTFCARLAKFAFRVELPALAVRHSHTTSCRGAQSLASRREEEGLCLLKSKCSLSASRSIHELKQGTSDLSSPPQARASCLFALASLRGTTAAGLLWQGKRGSGRECHPAAQGLGEAPHQTRCPESGRQGGWGRHDSRKSLHSYLSLHNHFRGIHPDFRKPRIPTVRKYLFATQVLTPTRN